MSTYVAMLRGINVGGKHRLPMDDLRAMFEEAGCADVRTYIQSGNVVFRAGAALTGPQSSRYRTREGDDSCRIRSASWCSMART